MNILNFRHPDISQNQFTSLTSQANDGDTSLNVLNTKGFAINQPLLIGTFGAEDTEIAKTHNSTPPTDTVITLLAALKFSHTTDTPVTILDYDQIEVYRAASEGGSYSLIATIDITPDAEGTTYKDTAGVSSDYYKIRYKNSIDSAVSAFSAEIPATGFGDDTLAAMVNKVFGEFSKQSDKLLDRDQVIDWLYEGVQEMVNLIIDLDIDYYVKYGTDGNGALIAFVANQRAYALPTDFVKPRQFLFTYDNVNFYPAVPQDRSFFDPKAVYSRTNPVYFFEHKKIVPLPKPNASTGGILPVYYFMPTKVTDDSGTYDLPIGYSTNPVNFALYRAFNSDQKYDVADYYKKEFDAKNQSMLLTIKKRSPELPKYQGMFGEELDDADTAEGFVLPT